MADERDFRIKLDLAFAATEQSKADELVKLLLPYLEQGLVIKASGPAEERGYIQSERCGHRLGVACTLTGKWEVGKGKVV